MERKIINNVRVVVPLGYEKSPLDCPLCDLSFRGFEDILSFKKHGCCTDCDLKYRQPNKKIWLKGWRPKIGATDIAKIGENDV